MGITAEAILPKSYTSATKGKAALNKLLTTFAAEAQEELKTYPAWRPWKNPPRTGPRAGGKRTGQLGRAWNGYTLVPSRSITLENKTPYAQYVQGPKGEQAKALAARGWSRVDEVGKRAARRAVAKVKMEA